MNFNYDKMTYNYNSAAIHRTKTKPTKKKRGTIVKYTLTHTHTTHIYTFIYVSTVATLNSINGNFQ